jgi:hypothetical protein
MLPEEKWFTKCILLSLKECLTERLKGNNNPLLESISLLGAWAMC